MAEPPVNQSINQNSMFHKLKSFKNTQHLKNDLHRIWTLKKHATCKWLYIAICIHEDEVSFLTDHMFLSIILFHRSAKQKIGDKKI